MTSDDDCEKIGCPKPAEKRVHYSWMPESASVALCPRHTEEAVSGVSFGEVVGDV